jgi:hypothetical protein
MQHTPVDLHVINARWNAVTRGIYNALSVRNFVLNSELRGICRKQKGVKRVLSLSCREYRGLASSVDKQMIEVYMRHGIFKRSPGIVSMVNTWKRMRPLHTTKL